MLNIVPICLYVLNIIPIWVKENISKYGGTSTVLRAPATYSPIRQMRKKVKNGYKNSCLANVVAIEFLHLLNRKLHLTIKCCKMLKQFTLLPTKLQCIETV